MKSDGDDESKSDKFVESLRDKMNEGEAKKSCQHGRSKQSGWSGFGLITFDDSYVPYNTIVDQLLN